MYMGDLAVNRGNTYVLPVRFWQRVPGRGVILTVYRQNLTPEQIARLKELARSIEREQASDGDLSDAELDARERELEERLRRVTSRYQEGTPPSDEENPEKIEKNWQSLLERHDAGRARVLDEKGGKVMPLRRESRKAVRPVIISLAALAAVVSLILIIPGPEDVSVTPDGAIYKGDGTGALPGDCGLNLSDTVSLAPIGSRLQKGREILTIPPAGAFATLTCHGAGQAEKWVQLLIRSPDGEALLEVRNLPLDPSGPTVLAPVDGAPLVLPAHPGAAQATLLLVVTDAQIGAEEAIPTDGTDQGLFWSDEFQLLFASGDHDRD